MWEELVAQVPLFDPTVKSSSEDPSRSSNEKIDMPFATGTVPSLLKMCWQKKGNCSNDVQLEASLVPVEGVCPPEILRSRQVIVQLQQKILQLTEQITVEQAAGVNNVAEYLRLVNNVDQQQSTRIKQVFEKKNQKTAQTVRKLQKKLDLCKRKLTEVEQGGPARQHKDMHQSQGDVGARVVTKPQEGASLVYNRFGSTENVCLASREWQEELTGEEVQSSPRYVSEDEASTATSGSGGPHSTSGVPEPPPSPRATLRNLQSLGLNVIFHQLQDIGRSQACLQDALEKLKDHYKKDELLMQDQRLWCNRMEEQLNDLIELNQNNMLILEQELASVEERITYQCNERAKDMQEALEAYQTRIFNMELQQQQQGGQMGAEDQPRDPLLGNLITVLLALISMLLICVSTAANCTVPLLKTRSRILGSLLLLLLLAILWGNWDTLTPYLDQVLEVYA
ncbi:hypothetical protein AAFF_G00343970 [Aldrovandia affinis]|uniref:Uncharacterized protein n=1 Tax=Aldrovandia affinis TaxID=143900 RepID=A0AAD7SL51_9TELE|nr:hypothetical protein AAFF_G00343970 [Aldrovandia affinis]